MASNIEKYKDDLKSLIDDGFTLHLAIQNECYPDAFNKKMLSIYKDNDKVTKVIKALPNFKSKYQEWYSESLVVIKFLLPDRLADFIRLYEKPKGRKDIAYGNYVLEDYMQSLTVTNGAGEKKVGPNAAIPQFEQQINILKSVEKRFESSLFDIKQLVQADLFDSELDSARELIKKKFYRAAGAIGGVVLEKHLHQVCENHNLAVLKKNPTINDFNELLKQKNVIDIPQWRFIQHLGDIRNLCDHHKDPEPTIDQVSDLINGVDKICKTLF